MAEQSSSTPRRRHMSGLKERLGGEGKIQWSTSLSSRALARSNDISFWTLLIATVALACLAEYTLAMGTLLLCVGLLLTGLYAIRSRPHDNIPMGDGYVPFFGHTPNVVKHWNDFFDEETRQLLKVDPSKRAYYSTSIPLGKHFIFIVDPKLIDLLFRLRFGDADKGPEIRDIMAPLMGKGIFVSDGAIWKKHRSIASRMFTVRSLKEYMFEVFVDTTDAFLRKCEAIQREQGYIDLYDMFNRLTLEAFTMIAFGVPLGTIACAPQEVKFSTAFDEGLQICTKRFFDVTWPLQRWLNVGRERALRAHVKVINEFASEIIRKKRRHFETLQQKNKHTVPVFGGKHSIQLNSGGGGGDAGGDKYKWQNRYDLMSMFLRDDANIKDEELRDVALNFIIAGRDTTAQLLSWFSYLITQPENQDAQEKILQEIRACLGGGGGDDSGGNDKLKLDYNSINSFTYLENAFLETLRLRPSVPHLVRYAKTDIKLPNGDVIRKGDGIVIPTYAMGRMPWIWKDPLKFNPDRFDDKGQKYTPSEYPAFNIPPRLCLGKHVALLEAKIAIIKLFEKYKLEPLPDQTVTYEFSVTNQMKHGFKVKLIPRT